MRLISLVTTVKNEAGSARDLIEAVRRQSRPPGEWVVVDGGSTDGTAELFAAEPGCRLLRASGNIAHGRNVAISHAKGDLIAVTDGGCRPAPDWLALLIEPLAADRADITAGASVPHIHGPFDVAQWALLDQFVMPSMPFREPALSSRSLAFRREVWEHTAYPEWLDHGEDTWAIRAWIAAGRRLVRVPGAEVEWRLRDGVAAFLAQHYRYMQGDGRARLHGWRHFGRFAFYAVLVGLLVWSAAGRPWAAVAGAGLWLTYLAASAARLLPLLPGRGFGCAVRSLAWVPPLLLGMDVAKAVGYLRGRLDPVPGRRAP